MVLVCTIRKNYMTCSVYKDNISRDNPIKALFDEYRGCTMCPLHEERETHQFAALYKEIGDKLFEG